MAILHDTLPFKVWTDPRLTRLPGIGHMPHHVGQDGVIDAIDRAA